MNSPSVNRSPGQRRMRALLLGRHFWPHGSTDSGMYLIQMASALHRQGVHVEVVTPRYASSWPEQFTIREITVHRPVSVPRRDWSLGRYVRHLTTWLRPQAGSFDVMLVDAIREEAMAAVEVSRSSGCPAILRCGRWGAASDPMWWETGRSARRCGAVGKLADAVVAKSAMCQRALLADGYKANRIHRIDDGFAAGPTRTQAARWQARQTLAVVNSDLHTAEDTPVILCASPMTREGGVNLLVQAARHLVARHPQVRFWFVGDGPHRDWIYESLRGDGLRASFAMPGSFCDMSDLMAAADLFVQPDDHGLEAILPAAVAAELPVVALNTESTRTVLSGASVETSQQAQWCPDATPKSMLRALAEVLDDLPAARARATELRRDLLRTKPLSETIASYIELMERVIRQHPHQNAPSTKAVS